MKQCKYKTLSFMLIMVVMLSACAKKPLMDAVPVPVAAASESSAVSESGSDAASATLSTSAGDRLEPVYFDFDSHALSSAAQKTLERNAAVLRQESGLAVTIEGHCDERGSDEYNLALGEQRAAAVKSYLVTVGVDAARLTTISYGEERSAVSGNDESAWSKNRRAAFN